MTKKLKRKEDKLTKKELDTWFKYQKALKNGAYFEREDKRELLRLNHLVMEASHAVHNENMTDIR